MAHFSGTAAYVGYGDLGPLGTLTPIQQGHMGHPEHHMAHTLMLDELFQTCNTFSVFWSFNFQLPHKTFTSSKSEMSTAFFSVRTTV